VAKPAVPNMIISKPILVDSYKAELVTNSNLLLATPKKESSDVPSNLISVNKPIPAPVKNFIAPAYKPAPVSKPVATEELFDLGSVDVAEQVRI
jgi:hypothetical protein